MILCYILFYSFTVLGNDLFHTRYDWIAETTFYYHHYYGTGGNISAQEYCSIIYTDNFGYSNYYQSFDHYRARMAFEYPQLMGNAQFIYCSKFDDPENKLAGRTPLFKPTSYEPTYFDMDYLMQHFNGYNNPYNIRNIKNPRHAQCANYMRYVRNPPLTAWRERFEEHYENIGPYYDWVHEFPNDSEHRKACLDRPSDLPPKPHTIFKQPSLQFIPAYIKGFSWLAAGMTISYLVFGGFK